ncbi:hypothetical protein DXG01_016508 [Tephrocybe rancida]|nr:hypothetical protein DXG01_016508 [Tephrocybe rancida]
MVLTKRKRDGEFVAWTPAGQKPAPTLAPEIPPAKKARTKAHHTSSAMGASASSSPIGNASSQPARTASHATSSGGVSYLPPRAETIPRASQVSYAPQPTQAAKPRKNADAPKPEKRGARYKVSCPKNILDRVERVMSQRFFMIDRQRAPGELKETFSVLGSTGNVYTVTIDSTPRCNCPDALKGNHCKHILFILLKVLQVTQASGIWYQKALLTTELETIFAEAPLAPNSLANPRIRDAHARATGKAPATTAAAETSNKKRIPGPDDDCPICYDGMHGVNETSLTFCEDCGNALHKQCFEQWRSSTATSGKQLTCVWCRAPWIVATRAGANPAVGTRTTAEGYLNLADASGISPIRDTSTYYHGPRRGQRHYGYQDYLD